MFSRLIKKHPAIFLAAVLTAGTLCLAAETKLSSENLAAQKQSVPQATEIAQQSAIPAAGFSAAVKHALPAIVKVSSVRVLSPVEFSDQPLFGGPSPTPWQHKERGQGSGVIVTPDGYILTNNHVVDGASTVRVTLADKREFDGRIIGTDEKSDVAVLKIDATGLPSLALGDSSSVQVGDVALAIGNPFGLEQTVTMGIISATGRGGLGIEQYEDFIQTDAAINPGNSGGALINSRGELIGINTAILSNAGGGNQGIGFAIPANMAQKIMNAIRNQGQVVRGWLGISIQTMDGNLAKAFGVSDGKGALVSGVLPQGPADRGGLEKGDVIRSVAGAPVSDGRELSMKIAETSPGTTVPLTVVRNGAERRLSVVVGTMPDQKRAAADPVPEAGKKLGVAIQEVNPEIARDLGIDRATSGVLIVAVQPDSPAADSGIQPGDIVQEVDHKPVKTASEFKNAVASSNPIILLSINRAGETVFMAVDRSA